MHFKRIIFQIEELRWIAVPSRTITLTLGALPFSWQGLF